MHESGLMNKWIAEQIPSKDKCSDSFTNQGIEERKVNVTDMQGIFFVLFIGNVCPFFACTTVRGGRNKHLMRIKATHYAPFRRGRIDISFVLRVLLAQAPSVEATQVDSAFCLLSRTRQWIDDRLNAPRLLTK